MRHLTFAMTLFLFCAFTFAPNLWAEEAKPLSAPPKKDVVKTKSKEDAALYTNDSKKAKSGKLVFVSNQFVETLDEKTKQLVKDEKLILIEIGFTEEEAKQFETEHFALPSKRKNMVAFLRMRGNHRLCNTLALKKGQGALLNKSGAPLIVGIKKSDEIPVAIENKADLLKKQIEALKTHQTAIFQLVKDKKNNEAFRHYHYVLLFGFKVQIVVETDRLAKKKIFGPAIGELIRLAMNQRIVGDERIKAWQKIGRNWTNCYELLDGVESSLLTEDQRILKERKEEEENK